MLGIFRGSTFNLEPMRLKFSLGGYAGDEIFSYDVVFNGGQSYYTYDVNLKELTQRNKNTGTCRKIRRLVTCNPV